MKRYAAGKATVICGVWMLAGCAAQQASEGGLNSPAPLTALDLQLNEPRTAAALLYNMRAVLERGSMIRRSFFTEEHLKATFGGSTVQWYQNSAGEVHCRLENLDYLPVRAPKLRIPRIGFIWSDARSNVQGKPHFANFSIACACDLTSRDVEAQFGDLDRTAERDRRLDGTHYPAPPRATDPLGNKVVTYKIRGPDGYVTSFGVQYDYRGSVTVMTGRLDPAPDNQPMDSRRE